VKNTHHQQGTYQNQVTHSLDSELRLPGISPVSIVKWFKEYCVSCDTKRTECDVLLGVGRL